MVMEKKMNESFYRGFFRKCAEEGVSPEQILEVVNSGNAPDISNLPKSPMGGRGVPNQTGPYAQGVVDTPGIGMPGGSPNRMGGQADFNFLDLLNNLPPDRQQMIVEILQQYYSPQNQPVKSAGKSYKPEKVPFDGNKKKKRKKTKPGDPNETGPYARGESNIPGKGMGGKPKGMGKVKTNTQNWETAEDKKKNNKKGF